MSEHGTSSRYLQGCRCEPCRAARAEYRRAYKAATGNAPDRRRFDWQPLEDLLRARLGPVITLGAADGRGMGPSSGATDDAMAESLGVTRKAIGRWRLRGSVTSRQADRAAVALGLHPALIWTGWYSDEAAS